MNQKLSLTGFASGLITFLGTATEIITDHTTWKDFTTPIGVLHLLVLGGSFVLMILGALGVQLPRGDYSHGDRRTDATPPIPPGPLESAPPAIPPVGTTVTTTVTTEEKK